MLDSAFSSLDIILNLFSPTNLSFWVESDIKVSCLVKFYFQDHVSLLPLHLIFISTCWVFLHISSPQARRVLDIVFNLSSLISLRFWIKLLI